MIYTKKKNVSRCGFPKRHERTTNATSKRGRPLPNSDAPQIEEQLPEKKTRGVAPLYKATGLLTRHEARTNARMMLGWPYRILNRSMQQNKCSRLDARPKAFPKDANLQPLPRGKEDGLWQIQMAQIEGAEKRTRGSRSSVQGRRLPTRRENSTSARRKR